MRKIALYATIALTIGLFAMATPASGRSDEPETASTTRAWVPIWALRAAVDVPAAGTAA
ncbi:hypothetical protein ACFVUY_20955 [Kitasatospora sp. NPDC058063]|uniref:hypothetical protein n=1 Tax=unclassified Kitasatospora TaxID=2633591 RepID=UPI0036DDFF82